MQQSQRVAHAEPEEMNFPLTMTIPSVHRQRKRGHVSATVLNLSTLDIAVLNRYADSLVHVNNRVAYRIAKRCLDVTGALFGLVFGFPFMLLIALLIKLDSPGPVLFRQIRLGKDGAKFPMYKFRTMHSNADAIKFTEAIQKRNKLKWPDFKIEDDPRVTRVGHVLRKFSLDELPNFINVLRGEMSLVGPRPTSFHEDKYDEWHKLRLKAIPGITGLHQVNGRSDLEFDERVRLDIDYINRQSMALDLRILIRTAVAVSRRSGAY
jgi:lipopolysaccharide/colanic/teichoic acid biosynthesis glycosyltransferase